MQQINLYNPAFEKKRELLSLPGMAMTWGGAAVLVAIAVVAAGMRAASTEAQLAEATSQRSAAQAQIGPLTAQAAGRKLSATVEDELRRLEAGLASRKEVVQTLGTGVIGDTKGFSEHLKAFARQSFDGLWLTGLTLSNAGRDIVVEGRALNPGAVPGYVQNLNRELVMRGHAFAELEMRRPGGKTAEKAGATAPFIEFRLATVAQVSSTGARN